MKDILHGALGILLVISMLLPSIIGIFIAFSESIFVGVITLLLPPLSVITGFLFIFTDANLAEVIGKLF